MHSNELPRLLLITGRKLMRPSFQTALESALRGGIRLIQLREKDLPFNELQDLAASTAKLSEKYGAQLLINTHTNIALKVKAAGVHLPGGISPAEARKTLGATAFIGASAHSIEEAKTATIDGADYLTFGSVFQTNSHPGAAPAGLEALREIVKSTPLPVFAIGGIDAERAPLCLAAGAHGIAVISAIWNAEDVEAAARELTAAVSRPC